VMTTCSIEIFGDDPPPPPTQLNFFGDNPWISHFFRS
jgi:hypothetical protein